MSIDDENDSPQNAPSALGYERRRDIPPFKLPRTKARLAARSAFILTAWSYTYIAAVWVVAHNAPARLKPVARDLDRPIVAAAFLWPLLSVTLAIWSLQHSKGNERPYVTGPATTALVMSGFLLLGLTCLCGLLFFPLPAQHWMSSSVSVRHVALLRSHRFGLCDEG